MQKEHETIVDKLRQELKKIHDWFPKIKELLRIGSYCLHIGFDEELTRMILEMKPVAFHGQLYSPEHKQRFKTERSVAEIKKHPTESDKLELTIDNVEDTNWFRQKYKEFQEAIGIKPNQEVRMNKSKGFRV